MDPTNYYRVVGVRNDGSKRLLCGHLRTKELAERVAGAVKENSPFASLVVECDRGSMHELPLTRPD